MWGGYPGLRMQPPPLWPSCLCQDVLSWAPASGGRNEGKGPHPREEFTVFQDQAGPRRLFLNPSGASFFPSPGAHVQSFLRSPRGPAPLGPLGLPLGPRLLLFKSFLVQARERGNWGPGR